MGSSRVRRARQEPMGSSRVRRARQEPMGSSRVRRVRQMSMDNSRVRRVGQVSMDNSREDRVEPMASRRRSVARRVIVPWKAIWSQRKPGSWKSWSRTRWLVLAVQTARAAARRIPRK